LGFVLLKAALGPAKLQLDRNQTSHLEPCRYRVAPDGVVGRSLIFVEPEVHGTLVSSLS